MNKNISYLIKTLPNPSAIISQILSQNEVHIQSNESICFLYKSSEKAHEEYQNFKQLKHCYYIPDIFDLDYLLDLDSETKLNKYFDSIGKLFRNEDHSKVIFTSYQAFFTLHPQLKDQKTIQIKVDEIYNYEDLKIDLNSIGYTESFEVDEFGQYSPKGEIFDIHNFADKAYRITFFDEIIESIFEIDPETKKSLKDVPIEEVIIKSSSYSVLKDRATEFKKSLSQISTLTREKKIEKDSIVRKLNNNERFPHFNLFFLLFFENRNLLSNLLSNTHFVDADHSNPQEYIHHQMDQTQSLYDEDIYFIPNIEQLIDIKNTQSDSKLNQISLNYHESFQSIKDPLFAQYFQNFSLKSYYLDINNFLSEMPQYKCIIYYSQKEHIKSYQYLLREEDPNLSQRIEFKKLYLEESYIDNHDLALHYTLENIIHQRSLKISKSHQDFDVFSEQLSTLSTNDYVIHKDFGIGKYLGINQLDHSGVKGDFVTLEYKNNNLVYVPIHKLDLIQKHASSESTISVSDLNTKSFEKTKSKTKSAVKKLAFDLLEIQAKREAYEGFSFSEPGEDFHSFCNDFKYKLTTDQQYAVDDILHDLQSSKPMDRLVCGDVGFGKTEVAMRAAFKAVEDGKQVAILVPTTILAYQHYNSFKERFSNFPVTIDYVSRLRNKKDENLIYDSLEKGSLDIIIGTHKLLSEKIKYHDLGLLIIDEEQRFGVNHKEKIKSLKTHVDCLTLTATPIPRTLQTSFLGIRDLSVIQTAPANRKSIKTSVIYDNQNIIKKAIEYELSRSGQVYIIHNVVNDIDIYANYIRKIVPNARIQFAHGQMAKKELEKIITDFYHHKFDILIATTIIESGIDIPNANTMIVDQAQNYGLSQLHQLRGRIGRSDRKAYAYFITPPMKNLSEIAQKRLVTIQKFSEIGQGFALASADLEIRGAGDVLGAEQSGQINSVGLELYLEMLKEAVAQIKNHDVVEINKLDISSHFECFIPELYISQSGRRLKYYKILSQTTQSAKLNDIFQEIVDIFGAPPVEFSNLIELLRIKCLALENELFISEIKIMPRKLVMYFNFSGPESEDFRNKAISFFMGRPNTFKIQPNNSVIAKFQKDLSLEDAYSFIQFVAGQIVP